MSSWGASWLASWGSSWGAVTVPDVFSGGNARPGFATVAALAGRVGDGSLAAESIAIGQSPLDDASRVGDSGSSAKPMRIGGSTFISKKGRIGS